MSLKTFIKTWDEIVSKWMNDPILTIQREMAGDSKFFESQYMPEPYLGDPERCSFVIVNLNPGQGRCHSWWALKGLNGTLINAVAKCKYSLIASAFLYLVDGVKMGLKDWDNNEATKWWKRKEPWLNSIYSLFNKSIEDIKPFAVELCGWHSENWPPAFNKKTPTGKITIQDVISVMCEAIDKSKFKFAYSVGKPIGNILCNNGFVPITKSPFNPPDGVCQPFPNKERYYRILHDDKNHYVINTWSQGSNNYPSGAFWNEEKKMIQIIKTFLSTPLATSTPQTSSRKP